LGLFLLFHFLVAVVENYCDHCDVGNNDNNHLAILVNDFYFKPPVNVRHRELTSLFPLEEGVLTADKADDGDAGVAVDQHAL
jgi:hypothetical protein